MIVANWKMNGDKSLSQDIAKTIKSTIFKSKIVLCPPFTHILYMMQLINHPQVVFGAQNCSQFRNGAHTGSISCLMLHDLGVKYVIIGHSECRDKMNVVINKIPLILEYNMIPILCLGASVHSHNYRWLKNILNKIKNFNTIIVAYEPIWAIGTGITPSLKDIESVADIISDQYPCLYGGSVNEHNINDIMQIKNLSGVMVGKASIESFNLILQ